MSIEDHRFVRTTITCDVCGLSQTDVELDRKTRQLPSGWVWMPSRGWDNPLHACSRSCAEALAAKLVDDAFAPTPVVA